MKVQMRGLLVGQAPPKPREALPEGYLPLQGLPERRLARLAGLASVAELWSLFDRVDLLGWYPGPKDRKEYHLPSLGYRKHNWDGHRFPLREARLAAGRLMAFGRLARTYRVVVLCGRKVAAAFGLKLLQVPWTEQADGVKYVVLPHPSGVSHYWNDEINWHRAAGIFRAAMQVARLHSRKQNSVRRRIRRRWVLRRRPSSTLVPGASRSVLIAQSKNSTAARLHEGEVAGESGLGAGPRKKYNALGSCAERLGSCGLADFPTPGICS